MARTFKTSICTGRAPDEKEGYPGNTSASQDRAVLQLRSELRDVNFTDGQDDPTLLRFLRARSFDVKQAKFRLIDVDRWRKKFGVSSLPPYKKSAERYYHKTDRDGRPLLIVRLKDLDLQMLGNKEAEGEYLRNWVSEIEHLVEVRLPACSRAAAAGKLIESTRVIIDLDGLKMVTIQKTYGLVRSLVLVLENYPERLHMLYIINPPMAFTTVGLSHIKLDMSPVTARKIEGLGKGYQQELLAAVSEDNLPVALGGKCKCELGCELSDAGPWQDDKFKNPGVPGSKKNAESGIAPEPKPGILAANPARPEATESVASDPIKPEASSPELEPRCSTAATDSEASFNHSEPRATDHVLELDPGASKVATGPKATSEKPEPKVSFGKSGPEATDPVKPEARSPRSEPELGKVDAKPEASSPESKPKASAVVVTEPEASSEKNGPKAGKADAEPKATSPKPERKATEPVKPEARKVELKVSKEQTEPDSSSQKSTTVTTGPDKPEARPRKAAQPVTEVGNATEAASKATTNGERTNAADPGAPEPMGTGPNGSSTEDSQEHKSELLELESAADSLALSIRALAGDLNGAGSCQGPEPTGEIDEGEADTGCDSSVSSTGSFDENVTYIPEDEQTAEADSPTSRASEDIPESSPRLKPHDGRVASVLPVLAGPRNCAPRATVTKSQNTAKALRKLPENWEDETF